MLLHESIESLAKLGFNHLKILKSLLESFPSRVYPARVETPQVWEFLEEDSYCLSGGPPLWEYAIRKYL
jgi:hypothetical protein